MTMPPLRRRALLQALAALGAGAGLVPAHAGGPYPAKPITLVVPSLPGGGTDAIARAFAAELAKHLGQSVVVENAAGASGAIGAMKVAHAAPDGYTLLLANSDLVLAPIVHRSAGYSMSDFVPLARINGAPLSLVARAGFPAHTVDELVSQAKANPGKITVGVSGVAALPSLAVAMLEQAAGIELLKVPYKGASQVMTDLLAGQVDLAVTAVVNGLGAARAGRVQILGVMSQERVPIAPDLPLMRESSAAAQVSLDIWSGLFGPAGMPSQVVEAINKAAQDVLRDPAYRASRAKTGERTAEPASAADFARFVKSEAERYRGGAARLPKQ